MKKLQSKLFDSLMVYWQTVVNELRENLEDAYPMSSGATASAIGTMNERPIQITSRGFKVSISMPEYYEFLDEGVKGKKSTYSKSSGSPFAYTDKMPPIDSIRKFMLNRGISKQRPRKKRKLSKKSASVKRKSRKSNTRAGRKQDNEAVLNSIAFAIAKSIFNKGLEATNFYSDVINDPELIKFEARLLSEFGDFITEIVRVENK